MEPWRSAALGIFPLSFKHPLNSLSALKINPIVNLEVLGFALKDQSFDLDGLRARGYAYERLDQLTMELLLGVR